jgi:hypothetical protein
MRARLGRSAKYISQGCMQHACYSPWPSLSLSLEISGFFFVVGLASCPTLSSCIRLRNFNVLSQNLTSKRWEARIQADRNNSFCNEMPADHNGLDTTIPIKRTYFKKIGFIFTTALYVWHQYTWYASFVVQSLKISHFTNRFWIPRSDCLCYQYFL